MRKNPYDSDETRPTVFTVWDAVAGGRAHQPTLPRTPQYFESDAAGVYEVACKIENYVDMYRMHWAGYSHTEDTWEPEDNLNGSTLLQEYKMHNHTLITRHRARAQQHSAGNSHVPEGGH